MNDNKENNKMRNLEILVAIIINKINLTHCSIAIIMEYETENGYLPTESLTGRGFPKFCTTLPSSLPHNIFKDRNALSFNPSERPVGGTSTIQRIKESFLKGPPSSNSNCTF